MSGRASFLGGDLFWSMLLAYKTVWFMGRYGAGKTSLAVLCAARLLAEKRVEKIVSNIPMSFSTLIQPPRYDENGEVVFESVEMLLHAGILLDEAWMYVDDKQATMDYAGFVRKFDHYLLLPSVFPVNIRLSYFYVQRVFNGYTLGLPLWFYKWNINNRGIKEKGYFAIRNPHAVFGHYPTDFVPGDDGFISDTLVGTAVKSGFKGTRKQQKAKRTKGKQVTNETENTSIFEDLENMEDISTQIQETTEDLSSIARVLQRSRK